MISNAPRILVVDGNTAEINAANERAGGVANAIQYTGVLTRLDPSLDIDSVTPSEHGVDCLPRGVSLADFDGIAWTGSALNIYDDSAAINHQLQLAERAFASGTPNFGSCWGLQMFTQVLGGTVRRNPRGRELGIARCVHLTEAGRAHPMYAGKSPAFDAMAVHTDEVDRPPDGALLLASNTMSQWQAMAYEDAAGSFWGVQYHPEFDLQVLAVIMARYGQRLVDDGLFPSAAALAETTAQWRALHDDPQRIDLAFRYGITEHITDRDRHERELRNWLEHKVRPRHTARLESGGGFARNR